MTEQFDLILTLAGGEVKPRAMLPGGKGLAGSRPFKLAASALGYARSFVFPSMAIVGDSLSWGIGDIRLLPRIDGITFLKEVLHGRPVVFIHRTDARPYQSLTRQLNFDDFAQSQTLLNGNDCLAFSGFSAGQKVFAHVGKSDHGRGAVQRHYEGLSTARAALMHTSLIRAIATPEPIQDNQEAIAFRQNCLDGEKVDLRTTQLEEFGRLIESAASPLIEMHRETARSDGPPERRFIRRMKSDLRKVSADPSVSSGVERILSDVELWLEERKPSAVCVHGDYTFSNLLFDGERKVSAIVDWEWTRGNGCAGYDLMHLGLSSGSAQFGMPVAVLAAAIASQSEIPRPLMHFFEKQLPNVGLQIHDITSLAKLCWLGNVFRSSVWTPPPRHDWVANTVAPMLRASQ